MKIYIRADSSESAKTTFYKVNLDDVISYYENKNAWIYAAFKYEGFDCLNIKDMYGSKIIDDTLYLCVTNGVDIDVNGESVDPEEALDKYSIDDLSEYIKDATDKVIRDELDDAVIKDLDNNDKYTEWALELLNSGFSFVDLVDSYNEIN